jgi:gamma-carbonic anhydrase
MLIIPFKDKTPVITMPSFTARGSVICGNVHIGEKSSVWYNSVIRGDVNEIRIGNRTNIQDSTVIHVATFGCGTYIGNDVTIGHLALLHACTVGDGAYIGMQSVVMDGAVVENRAMLAAGSLVPPKKTIPRGELWGGRPAKFMRLLTEDDYKMMQWNAEHYWELAQEHAKIIIK